MIKVKDLKKGDVLKFKRSGELVILLKLKEVNFSPKIFGDVFFKKNILHVFIGLRESDVKYEWEKLA